MYGAIHTSSGLNTLMVNFTKFQTRIRTRFGEFSLLTPVNASLVGVTADITVEWFLPSVIYEEC
jgi:hypothetical protein